MANQEPPAEAGPEMEVHPDANSGASPDPDPGASPAATGRAGAGEPAPPSSILDEAASLQPAVAKLHDLTPRQRRLIVVRLVLRVAATTALLIGLYYLAPLDRNGVTPDARTIVALVCGLLLLTAMIVWQTKLIVNADYPGLRAIEALAVTTPFYLTLFAATYVLIGNADVAAFSEPLDRTSSLYFTVTVFATVGFGDITAKTQLARVVVMVQMVLDLMILGLGLRLFLGAVKVGQRRRDSRTDPSGR